MEKLTPMLKQYMDVKNEYQDALVMFRLGDFYELFFDDAKIASYELDLVLTGRAAGDNQRAPMCGVPHHAVSAYIQKLVENGHKVAIVEQMEDPKDAIGLVRRDVVKVVTPGTMTDEWVDEKNKNLIVAITHYAGNYFFLSTELLSGETQIEVIKSSPSLLKAQLLKSQTREIVIPSKIDKETLHILREIPRLMISYEDETLVPDAYMKNLKGILDPIKHETYGRLLNYLLKTQKRSLNHLQSVEDEREKSRMKMDYSTLLNLELVEPLRAQAKHDTLFSFLDHCKSAMGSRLLRDWIIHPLIDKEILLLRQSRIALLLKDGLKREQLRENLSQIYDLERLIAKVSILSANPQDVLRLQRSLNQVPVILGQLEDPIFNDLSEIDPLNDLCAHLNDALNDELPNSIKDGYIFRSGFSGELDELREIQQNGRKWLVNFETMERERTQIKNLRIGYNRVFGYYIEISKGNIANIKEEFHYIRKQTLSTGERYITPELKEMEDKILHAQERSLKLEQELFDALIERISEDLGKLQIIARTLAHVDTLQALATVANTHHYVKPEFHDGFDLDIIEGRHPIMETKINYISNSTQIHAKDPIHLLTGPNMGGKSTYMRQVALIIILAQIGSYVPAKKATLPLIDAIYTRMGASDDILAGQSTFMLEMTEANTALQNATERSMVFFDEIGRGTSTFDGMALAQSMVEYLATVNKCKTIFSTHYHELTQLESSLPQIKNMHVEVHEENNEVTFLYRVKHGKADRSYGVNVARLAKLPPYILDRAQHLLKELESKKRVVQQSMEIVEVVRVPEGLDTLLNQLRNLKIEETTPLEALRYLDEWKKKLKD